MRNRKRNRMLGYDYSSNGLYFVTICVKDRVRCLGSVGASRAGAARVGASRDLPVQDDEIDGASRDLPVRSDRPILILNNYGLIVEERIKWLANQYQYVEVHNYVVMPDHVHLIIEINRARVKVEAVKIKSLSGLIGALKTTSSKLIHNSGYSDFAWQRSFHDSIIRNLNSYYNISRYIDLNPEKWIVQYTFINTL